MTQTHVPVSASWLALREPADAAARSLDLVRRLRARGPASPAWVVHDLGAGTGSTMRWLAAHLHGPQHWVLHDLDAELLATAERPLPRGRLGGQSATAETRVGDVTRLDPADLAGASLVTASALLDLLTTAALERIVRTIVAVGAPALLTLSVTGQVALDPPDPLDLRLGRAFDDHQRRTLPRGRLLGPDAARVAARLFAAAGYAVTTAASPWRLGPEDGDLTRAWLDGWVGAAVEQVPALASKAVGYRARRDDQLADGRLRVTLAHTDVLAMPQDPNLGRT